MFLHEIEIERAVLKTLQQGDSFLAFVRLRGRYCASWELGSGQCGVYDLSFNLGAHGMIGFIWDVPSVSLILIASCCCNETLICRCYSKVKVDLEDRLA